jgi:hypothetical protein
MLKRFRSFWDVMLLSCRNRRLAFCGAETYLRRVVGCITIVLSPPGRTQGDMVPIVIPTEIDVSLPALTHCHAELVSASIMSLATFKIPKQVRNDILVLYGAHVNKREIFSQK